MRRLLKIVISFATVFLVWDAVFHLSFPCLSASESILPKDLTMSEQFKNGYGAPVGKMILTQGKVIVVHQGILSGFQANSKIPLFKGDTLYTDEKARARFKLNDGSIMTISSLTKLTINKSIYDPQKKLRTSFLSLTLGKARFLVTKLVNFQKSTFAVKSGTFVAGVRGSDFVMTQTSEKTEITTLEKTSLEVTHMNDPELKPVLLSSFQHTSADQEGRLQQPQDISPHEADLLKQEFQLPGDDPGSSSDSNESKADKSGSKDGDKGKEEDRKDKERGLDKEKTDTNESNGDGKQEPKSDTDSATGNPMPSGELQGLLALDGMTTEGFLISMEELEKPDFLSPEFEPPPEPPELPPEWDPEKPEENPPEKPELEEELPGLPGLPQ
ncbi:MAG: hypothetical protein C0403_18795 [Desulfobacterium sp.]|nr:hypothetical protein [Desulfobacterium sp.]